MDARAMLDEAYAFTIDVLVMAATSLLVVNLMPPGDTLATYAKVSSWKAKALLEKLALQNCTAAHSLDGLAVSIPTTLASLPINLHFMFTELTFLAGFVPKDRGTPT